MLGNFFFYLLNLYMKINSKMITCTAYALIIIFFLILIMPHIMRKFDNKITFSNTKIIEGLDNRENQEEGINMAQELLQIEGEGNMAENQRQEISNQLERMGNQLGIRGGSEDNIMDQNIFNLGSTLQSTQKNNMNSLAGPSVDKLIKNADINIASLMTTLDISHNNSKQTSKLSTLLDKYTDNIKLIGLNFIINYDSLNIDSEMLHYYVNKYKDIMLILNDLKEYLNGQPGFFSKQKSKGGLGGLLP